MLAVDRTTRRLHDGERVFDPATRAWSPAPPPAQPEALTPEAALLWLQRESGHPLRTPVGVIGPNEASDAVLATAEAVGGVLARCGLTLLCGGRRGVMTAACRGASLAGGLSIGLLPSADPATANPFASVVLPSGVGEARNAIIAQASTCLVAVGNSYGTLSEVALGLRLSKPVFGLCGAAQVEGVVHLPGPEALAAALARELLGVG
jgi:uncharacterized protein (TIGR00725 family)